MGFVDKIAKKLGMTRSSVLMILALLAITVAFIIAKRSGNVPQPAAPVTAADNTSVNGTSVNDVTGQNNLGNADNGMPSPYTEPPAQMVLPPEPMGVYSPSGFNTTQSYRAIKASPLPHSPLKIGVN